MTEKIELPNSPRDIDDRISSKFENWRGEDLEQKKATEFILNNDKRFVMLTMPTGSGKSLVAVVAGIVSGKKTVIITRNTNLAKQYEKDFNIPVVIGRSHYTCILDNQNTAANCPFVGKYAKCPAVADILRYYEVKKIEELSLEEVDDITCPYVRVRELAKRSDVSVLNYHYFWFAYLSEGHWPKPEQVIVDEAHEFPNFLVDISTKKYDPNLLKAIDSIAHDSNVQKYFLPTHAEKGEDKLWRDARKYYRALSRVKFKTLFNEHAQLFDEYIIPPDKFISSIPKTIKYVQNALMFANSLLAYLVSIDPENEELKNITINPGRASIICEELPADLYLPCTILSKTHRTASRIMEFIMMVQEKKNDIISDDLDVNGNYILYVNELQQFVIKPIYPHHVFEELDKRLGHPKWVFMSATLFPRFMAKELALSGRYSWMELQSQIMKDFRTIFYVPYAPLYRDYMDQPPFVREYIVSVIDKVLNHYDDMKGIILVASNKDVNALQKYSAHRDRFIVYSGSNAEKERALRDHNAAKNTVLVSVAWEGIDLKDDLSRFQIIYQIPYPYLGDPVIRIRRRADREWYVLSAFNKVIQGSGRSIRHEGDYASTFIFDARFENMLKRYSNNLPDWFREAIKTYGGSDSKAKFQINLERAIRESREYYRKWQRITAI